LTSLFLYVPFDKVQKNYQKYAGILSDGGTHFLKFIDFLYHYWLKIERFGFLNNGSFEQLKNRAILFRQCITNIYYSVESNILCQPITVETNTPAGFLGAFGAGKMEIPYPEEYQYLNQIKGVSSVFLNLPYSTSTKRNKRIGVYAESKENYAANLTLKGDDWLCYPFYVGESLVYFYFNIRFTNNIIGIVNLFQKVELKDCQGKKPDIIIVYGGPKEKTTGTYYIDKKNDLMVGYVSDIDDADYFGYVKKLVLTLHNIRMINRGALPIHGSMVNIIMKSGRQVNVVIMGDSGAGKSESIEAFRQLAKEYLKDIKVIFDDMGTFFLEKGEVRASGTETGAFVRIDDLDVGYTFSHLYDSIIMNADETNARIVYQCTPYREVIKRWKIDIFLYADNYDANDCGIKFFDNYHDMVAITEDGKRKAKGTTGEVGLVHSYFANPFGPVQLEPQTHVLVEKILETLLKNGTKEGVIYTQLAVEGQNKTGPKNAARSLFNWINNLTEK
jgi:hypothetical protein